MVSRMISLLFIAASVLSVFGDQDFNNNIRINARQQNGNQNNGIRVKRILDAIFQSGYYDKRIRPEGTNGSTVVHVNIYLRRIDKLDDANEEFGCQINLRQRWNDKRLEFDDFGGKIKYLTLSNTEEIWTPDVFFNNEKDGYVHKIVKPNDLVRIYPNGDVYYSKRISLVLYCPMNLANFPFDRQTCSILLASYSYTKEDIEFLWENEDPVEVAKGIHLPKFTLTLFLTDYIFRKARSGEYTGLKVDFLFKREAHYLLVHIYIPCCMFVITSWIAFWLNHRDIVARLLVEIPTLLALSAFTYWTNASLPEVSYTKAIDIWTGFCVTFVFAALLECMTVNFAYRNWDSRKHTCEGSYDVNRETNEKGPQALAMEPLNTTADTNETSNMEKSIEEMSNFEKCLGFLSCGQRWRQYFSTYSEGLDIISRIFFPAIFAIFNLCYWVTYLHGNYDDEYY